MKEEEIIIPKGLEKKLENLIDHLAEQEAQTKRRRLWIGTFGAAASIALLISTGVWFHTKQNNDKLLTAYNIENSGQAYLEAQKALEKVSLNFNKGVNQLVCVSENLDKTNHILDKTFKK
ncbi:hypothetical protein FACS189413_14270 [Bacteroidia bacterium]|nr:hypothetical protein FACS189413_14270 [Bacteroidia bacterium]